MKEAIERINQYIAEQIESFGTPDKYTILQEVVKHQSEEIDLLQLKFMEYKLIYGQ